MNREKLKHMLIKYHPDKGGNREKFEHYYSLFKKQNQYKQFSYINLKYNNPTDFLLNLNI